ncbi:Tetratricopeptide-like helical [Moelleriella libera RCEF 2490]|uniref:Tetratricopeptide-like helical n=1 Tax=Moelleriella libera RCEF 2490 TaxID=1081109 RepID=A0A167VNR3_9HYPO|nr:Tetratricopeptide-like helical [Moelleriella libera RCEF 2490]
MDDCEALELLLTGLCESQTSNPDDAQRLLDLLAYLPLAIKQASAYMAKEQVSISTYLEDFEAGQDNILELLNEDFSDPHRYIGVQNPVAKTWLISFQHIAKRSPLAAEYLKFMSFLAAKDIPEFLLPPARTMEIRKAVGTLKGYAFITQLAGQESFDMHRLVRLATQMWLKKNGQLEKYAKSATQRLDEKFPYPIIDNKDMWTKCLPHVQAALEFRVPNTIPESKLSFKVALCLMFLGHCRGAENQARIAVESCERLLGKESPDTILSLHVLEKTLSSQGKFQETERIQRHSVKIRERVEGPGSPNTILSTIFLAETLRHQWKHRAAEELERRTVEVSDRFMGPRHPITLLSMRGLATALFHQGKFAEAEKMYREMLMIQELEQGPEHPFTLLGVENLAIALCRQGKYTEAEQMYRKTLKIHEREKGPEHPFTFLSIQGLASALHRQEKFAEAEQMYRKTFEIQKRVQGPDHPHTLSSLRGLAAVLLRLGKVAELEWILSGS